MESASAALGVFWVVGGALVFLVMAGLLLGLAVWGRREPRFELTPENETGATPDRYQVQTPAPDSSSSAADAQADLADKDWPDALP